MQDRLSPKALYGTLRSTLFLVEYYTGAGCDIPAVHQLCDALRSTLTELAVEHGIDPHADFEPLAPEESEIA